MEFTLEARMLTIQCEPADFESQEKYHSFMQQILEASYNKAFAMVSHFFRKTINRMNTLRGIKPMRDLDVLKIVVDTPAGRKIYRKSSINVITSKVTLHSNNNKIGGRCRSIW